MACYHQLKVTSGLHVTRLEPGRLKASDAYLERLLREKAIEGERNYAITEQLASWFLAHNSQVSGSFDDGERRSLPRHRRPRQAAGPPKESHSHSDWGRR